MKKLLFAALALAAVACSKSEVIEQTASAPISFENPFVNNSTKSANDPSFTTTNMFNDFAVYGFVEGATLFNGTTVSQEIVNADLKNSAWKYEGTQYWIAGANYNFAAIAPKTDGDWTVANNGAKKDGTTLTFTNDATTDLLYAQTNTIQGKVSGNDVVALNFRHILSKIKFSFENGYNATGATIAIRNIEITNAYQTATASLNATTTTWSTWTGSQTVEFGNATDNEETTDKEKANVTYAYGKTYESLNERFLIPGTAPAVPAGVNAYTVTFIVDLYVNGTKVKDYTHNVNVEFTPEAGKSYDIKATITPETIDPNNEQEPIEFTVTTLPGWGETNNVTM